MVIASSQPAVPASFDRPWLMPDELFAVDGKHVATITVDLGEVWISFDGEDLLVAGGQVLSVNTDDLIVIQTVSPGRADIRIDLRNEPSDDDSQMDQALPQLKL